MTHSTAEENRQLRWRSFNVCHRCVAVQKYDAWEAGSVSLRK